MVDVNWCLHPLEGIVLAGIMFALYYWVIRLRCRARMAQAFIFVAVLAVGLCTFTSLSIMVETDKSTYVNHTTTQVMQHQPSALGEAVENPIPKDVPSSPGVSRQGVSLLQYSELLEWVYAAGVVAVMMS